LGEERGTRDIATHGSLQRARAYQQKKNKKKKKDARQVDNKIQRVVYETRKRETAKRKKVFINNWKKRPRRRE